MSDDLQTFRDHARALADGGHSDDCPTGERRPPYVRRWKPKPCPGCVTDADRVLWARLADEVDAHLGRYCDTPLM